MRLDLKCPHHKKQIILYHVIEMLANTVVIIIHYISVSDQHIISLKFTGCYMSIISQQQQQQMVRLSSGSQLL